MSIRKVKSIAEVAQGYIDSVLPEHAPPNQKEGTRMAFMGGASMMFDMMIDASANLEEADAEKCLSAWQKEFFDFAADLMIQAMSENKIIIPR